MVADGLPEAGECHPSGAPHATREYRNVTFVTHLARAGVYAAGVERDPRMQTDSKSWDGRTLGAHRVLGRYWEAAPAMGRENAQAFRTEHPDTGAEGVGILLDEDGVTDVRVAPGWQVTLSCYASRVQVDVNQAPEHVTAQSVAGLAKGLDVATSVLANLSSDSATCESLANSAEVAEARRVMTQWRLLQGLAAQWARREPKPAATARRPLLAYGAVAAVVFLGTLGYASWQQAPLHHLPDVRPTVVPVALADTYGGGVAEAALEECCSWSSRSNAYAVIGRDLPKQAMRGQAVPDKTGKCQGSEDAINGGCWVETNKKGAKCPDDQFEWNGRCFVPVKKDERMPQASLP